jgi:hypothetical protein
MEIEVSENLNRYLALDKQATEMYQAAGKVVPGMDAIHKEMAEIWSKMTDQERELSEIL